MKKILAFLLVPGAILLFPKIALAHCPLCVAGAAAGVTLTRWIGVDDSITGVWLAAFLGAMSLWLSSRLKPVYKPYIYLVIFATTIWSFYKFQLVIRMTQIFGFDKLTFGMITGGVLFYLVDLIRIKHYFNYQKIAISLGSMAILSMAIYILINYYI
ncbi:MAG: hypothetical protein AAB535_04145 [Patescibacteria group bacterium]